jgi:CRP-like cAMP-binding protein
MAAVLQVAAIGPITNIVAAWAHCLPPAHMIDKLEKISIFKGLDHDVLVDISLLCQSIILENGETIIAEKVNESFDLFFLIRGNVEVTSNTTHLASGEAVLSREDKELLGELSWLLNVRRTATVKAVGEVEVIRVNGPRFMSFLERKPDGFRIMRRITRQIASRLNESDNLLKQILWNSNI